MGKQKTLILMSLVLAVAALCWGVGQASAQNDNQLRRLQAQDRLEKAIEARHELQLTFPPILPEYLINTPVNPPVTPLALLGYNPAVNYTLPNFAYSPNIRKFVDTLPGLGIANANSLGQYIPVAIPDTTTYPGSDYYEIGINQYTERLHPDLPVTGTLLRGYAQTNAAGHADVQNVNKYLGPAIIAKTYDPTKPAGVNGNGKPVRLKFRNQLPTGTAGNLFLPVDKTVMGAGVGPLDSLGNPCDPAVSTACANYSQNRAAIHLHGGATPWISDGTPHQWITPTGDSTVFKKGASFQNVPDMVNGSVVNAVPVPCIGGATCFTPAPGDGIGTNYYTNQQSSRLMFYHDHAYGITRLNVYGGMAAPYLLYDQVEQDLIEGSNVSGVNPTSARVIPNPFGIGSVYEFGIPLVIQDKTFVNDINTSPGAGFPGSGTAMPTAKTVSVDPLWYNYVPGAANTTGGNLWFPHEYMPNEDIYDIYNEVPPSGFNIKGRWDYGPWLAPALPANNVTLPSPTIIPEAFMDTMLVNGHPYPYVTLDPTAYRFRVLNACNDRILNLQLYYAAVAPASVTFSGGGGTGASATTTVSGGVVIAITLTGGGVGYTSPPTVTINDISGHSPTTVATAIATVSGGAVTGLTLTSGGSGYLAGAVCKAPLPAGVTQTMCAEVSMVPAKPNPAFPTWPSDGRAGGVPDPTTAGPDIWQIGNEGGLLPRVAVIPAQPVDYEYNRRAVTVLDVTSQSLLMGPAERADIIVDFYNVSNGSVLMVYNDSPAPMPLWDPRNDLYTGDPDQSATGNNTGGPPSTPPGFGPNNRTDMQIRISANPKVGPFNLAQLQTMLPKAYGATQPKPIAPQKAYDAAFGTVTSADIMAGVVDDSLNLTGTGQPVSVIVTTLPGQAYTTPPAVTFIGGGCTTSPSATATLNGVTAITVLTAGTLYTSPPTVTITAVPPDPGTGAQAIASIQGGVVTAITVTVPGSNYLVAPTVTLTGGTLGTSATAQASLVPGSVGTINLTSGGAGCTSAPLVFLTGGGGTGAGASCLLNGGTPLRSVGITEGFDVWYGRMNAVLGTTPVPLLPLLPAPAVAGAAAYIDPPSDFLNNNEVQIWRVSHIGADSHFVHWHLVNLQVVNRVDWTNSLLPPEPNELGWKETIRTNPFTDLIVAIRPIPMVLPFPIPSSSRLLDPTTPAGSTMNFAPVAPAPGAPAAAPVTNVVTDFGFEYVWHCHLLGHEENDMMRPLVLLEPTAVPAAPSGLTAVLGPIVPPATISDRIVLNWTDNSTTPPNNEIGFRIERCTGGSCTNFAAIGTVHSTITTYIDMLVNPTTTYRYQVIAFNVLGDSTPSNIAGPVTTPAWGKATGVTVTANPAPITAPPPPHYLAGTAVLITPTATGSTVPYQYRFWLDGVMVQDYGVGSTWTMPDWTAIGNHVITVDVRTSTTSPTPDVTSAPLTISIFAVPNLYEALITQYYANILGRAADAGGLAFWVSEIERIVSLGIDVKEGFIALGKFFFNSAEYLARNRTDTQYVTDLYQTFLGRAPDAAGLAFWVGYLTQGSTRNEVMNSFAFSTEFNAYMTGIFGAPVTRPENNLVNDFYRGLLSRLPDTAGFNSWLVQMRSAQCTGAQAVTNLSSQIALAFVNSAEYALRNRDNSGYVEDLYDAILRRGASPTEINGWVSLLNAGATRNQVLQGFTISTEFQSRVQAVINAGCLP